jgi:glycosyltransferase involved in cell wall biosynthesis
MNEIAVSVVLNMHREALFLCPTLLSLDACAIEAKKQGLKVELVAVFDRSDEATREVFYSTPLHGFSEVKTLEVDVGSLGLARNAGINEAKGEFIWTADGDDLVSSNAIVELFNTARNHPRPRVAVFLEFLVAFGDRYHVARYVGSEWLTAADFAFHHPYTSRIFIRRSAFDSLCYLDLKVTTGFAYEDWDLNSRLFAAGFEFITAPNAILFYRQRSNSLLKQANATSAKMIPHSELFEPKYFQLAMQSTRDRNTDWSGFICERQRLYERNFAQELLSSDQMRNYVADAAKLDPEVDPASIETANSYYPVPWSPNHWGFQLERFYQFLGSESFDDVLILPWLKPGGAEKYILQILQELHALGVSRRLLVLAGQAANKHEWTSKLPQGAVFVDVFNAFPMLDDLGRDAMLARALLAAADKGARLHIKASEFAHRLIDAYGSVLSSQFKVIYYRFCENTYSWHNKRLTGSWGIKFLRRHLGEIDLLISDCRSIALSDFARFGVHSNKYQVIYAQCRSREPLELKRPPCRRLLWASRVSTQKRPELVRAIATALRKEYPEMVIEVYGQIEQPYQQQGLFDVSGVEYRGSFDGFDSLPIERFDAFIYTSAFDGLPNIVLEALAAGLPVIAPDVGGVSEAVINGETGILIPDLVDEHELIAAYVDAVRRLYGNWACTLKMVDNGRRLVAERHGASNFRQRVAEVFGLNFHGGEVGL